MSGTPLAMIMTTPAKTTQPTQPLGLLAARVPR